MKMRRNALRCAVLLAAVAGGAVACNLILDTSSFSVCTTVGDAGWYDAGCLACVEASCCDLAGACAADPGCSARQSCLGAGYPLLSCGLAGGVEAGAGNEPSIVTAPAAALETCMAMNCAATCSGGPWACLDGFSSWPPNTGDAGVTITIDPTIFSGDLSLPLGPPVTLKQVSLCDETGCSRTFPGSGMPGSFSIQTSLPRGSYLDILAEPMGGAPDDDPLESLVYLSWPAITDTAIDLRFVTLSLLEAVAMPMGVNAFDTDAGTLVVLARDCQGNPAAGVTLAFWSGLDPNPGLDSDGFVFSGGEPEQAVAQESIPDAAPIVTTTGDGIAGWIEVTPGLVATFTASIDGGAAQIAKVYPVVQARSVTYVWLTPMPGGGQ